MKKNVIFILLLTILSSCKSEYEEYSGTDAIYLNEISDTVRFSFTYVDSEYETQAQDIHLKVIGKVADYDRPVNIKFTPVNAVEGVDFEPLEKEYVSSLISLKAVSCSGRKPYKRKKRELIWNYCLTGILQLITIMVPAIRPLG